MESDIARTNMIKQQLRSVDVNDERVLAAIDNTPRVHFVPKRLSRLAYTDMMLPIGHHQVMMLPADEARMLQALAIQATDIILEVGTGTGYVTTLLAKLGHEVFSVDIIKDFTDEAQGKLTTSHVENVHLATGDGSQSWSVGKLFDVIAITGSVPWVSIRHCTSLSIGGRLFAVVGTPPVMTAQLITRTGQTNWEKKILFETNLKPLINVPEKEIFIF